MECSGTRWFLLMIAAFTWPLGYLPGSVRAAPPLEAYARLPKTELVRLSPSGNHIALVGVVGESRRLIIVTVDGKVVKSGDVGDTKVRNLTWAGDEHVLLTTSTTANQTMDFGSSFELGTVLRVSLSDTNVWAVFEKSHSIEHTVQGFYGASKRDGRWNGYFGGITEMRGGGTAGEYLFEHGFADLYRVDLQSGETHIEAKGSEHRRHWVLGGDGAIAAHSDYDQRSGEWRLFGGIHGDTILLRKSAPTGAVEVVGVGRTEGTALVIDDSGDEDLAEEVNILDGKSTVLLGTHSISSFIFDPASRQLLGATTLDEPGVVLFDSTFQQRMDGARQAFPGRAVELASFSENFEKMIVTTNGPADSGTYWLVDVASGKAVPLGSAYPDVKAGDVGPTRRFAYRAGDGLPIEGVLTLPPDREAKGLPLVVFPHGGPIGILDSPTFDWWAQAFASRGYAVIQPNYRGSDGYGVQFRKAGFGQWGRKMLTDISDSIGALAKQQIIDPHRVCIMGGSYGGYAALAGVTLQHGLYRCAVSVAGPSDMPGFGAWQVARYGPYGAFNRYWRLLTGVDTEGEGVLHAISPASAAGAADAPILLIHGKDDTRVPIEQSEIMASALKRAGKPYEFVMLPNEDHFLSREATRKAMLQAAVSFVEKYNPPN